MTWPASHRAPSARDIAESTLSPLLFAPPHPLPSHVGPSPPCSLSSSPHPTLSPLSCSPHPTLGSSISSRRCWCWGKGGGWGGGEAVGVAGAVAGTRQEARGTWRTVLACPRERQRYGRGCEERGRAGVLGDCSCQGICIYSQEKRYSLHVS